LVLPARPSMLGSGSSQRVVGESRRRKRRRRRGGRRPMSILSLDEPSSDVGAPPALIVAHKCHGRIRLRSASLKRAPRCAAAVASRLRDAPGMVSAEARVATGSLVLRFDDRLSRDAVLTLAQDALRMAVSERPAQPEALAHLCAVADETADPARLWHVGDAVALSQRLDVDLSSGLSTEEAARRLRRFGPNRPPEDAPTPPSRLAAKQVYSLPVAMLAVSAIASAATGGFADAAATIAIVLANAALGYATEAQAERSIRALTGDSRRSVAARRDGAWTRVPAEALAPGDLVRLRAGRLAAARWIVGARPGERAAPSRMSRQIAASSASRPGSSGSHFRMVGSSAPKSSLSVPA